MFSATWPQAVRALARDFQTDAVFLNVGSLELAANHNVVQKVEVIDEYKKQGRLYEILNSILHMVNFLQLLLKNFDLFFRTSKKPWSFVRPSERPMNSRGFYVVMVLLRCPFT